jgi:hypothetical protein
MAVTPILSREGEKGEESAKKDVAGVEGECLLWVEGGH